MWIRIRLRIGASGSLLGRKVLAELHLTKWIGRTLRMTVLWDEPAEESPDPQKALHATLLPARTYELLEKAEVTSRN